MAESSAELAALNDGIAKLTPLLTSHGFSRAGGDTGSSSGGRFATVTFKRGKLEIGLIIRFGSKLGCPNYTLGNGYAGHTRVMTELNPNFEPKLVPGDSISYCSADGGDPFDALKYDLECNVLPMLANDSVLVDAAIMRAARAFQRELKSGG